MRGVVIMSSMALTASLVALLVVFTRGSANAHDVVDTSGRALALGERGDLPPIDVALARRVDVLEREVRVLRREVQILGEDGAFGAGRAVDAQGLDVDKQALASVSPPRIVEEKLQELVQRELQAENARRWESRRDRMIEHEREHVSALKSEHDVDEKTATQIEEMLQAENEQIAALFQSAREEGGGRRELRAKAREIRAETDENVRALLNEEQALAWDEKRLSERGRGRDGARRPRDDD
jgi:hypothetical protein